MSENDPQLNADGWVALRFYMTVPKYVEVNGREYVFNTNANLCISYVHPEDVDKILSMTHSCCNNQKHGAFFMATETEVRRWSGVSER